MWKELDVFVTTMLCAISVQAAAVMGFADSMLMMGDFSEDYQEAMVNYSPVVGHEFGTEFMRMRDKDGMTSTISALSYTGLIKRWNMPGAQANLWFTGGIGESHGDNQSGFAYTPSVQFDYETKR